MALAACINDGDFILLLNMVKSLIDHDMVVPEDKEPVADLFKRMESAFFVQLDQVQGDAKDKSEPEAVGDVATHKVSGEADDTLQTSDAVHTPNCDTLAAGDTDGCADTSTKQSIEQRIEPSTEEHLKEEDNDVSDPPLDSGLCTENKDPTPPLPPSPPRSCR